VQPGIEAGCLILRTFDGRKTYNVLFRDGKKPESGTAIFFRGMEPLGPTTCMQGIAVDVQKWAPLKKRCPSEPQEQWVQ
jgi:hypothetical protein